MASLDVDPTRHYNAENPWGPDGNHPENAYGEGMRARKAGIPVGCCPQYPMVANRNDWCNGWWDMLERAVRSRA